MTWSVAWEEFSPLASQMETSMKVHFSALLLRENLPLLEFIWLLPCFWGLKQSLNWGQALARQLPGNDSDWWGARPDYFHLKQDSFTDNLCVEFPHWPGLDFLSPAQSSFYPIPLPSPFPFTGIWCISLCKTFPVDSWSFPSFLVFHKLFPPVDFLYSFLVSACQRT